MANAKQLAMMTRVMDAYCVLYAIPDDAAQREYVALEILLLFDQGFRDEDALLDELQKRHQEKSASPSERGR